MFIVFGKDNKVVVSIVRSLELITKFKSVMIHKLVKNKTKNKTYFNARVNIQFTQRLW